VKARVERPRTTLLALKERAPGARDRLAVVRRTRLFVVVTSVVASLAFAWSLATASPRDRRFWSARHGVGLDAPNGWTLSQHTGYPEIIVLLLHPDGSRISVSAATTTARDALALAEQSRRGLEAQHLVIARVADGPRGGVEVVARNAALASELRQLYLVRPLGDGKSQAVVLTLVTRTDVLATDGPAFDWVATHLLLEPPAGTEAPPDTGARRSTSTPTSDAGATGREGERER
jgi:hypothetical protein